MAEQLVMNEKKDADVSARDTSVRRHAWWLAGVAISIFATYIVYVYVFVMTNST